MFAAIFTLLYVAWKGDGAREFGKMGVSGSAVAVFGAAGTAAFIPAFKLTSIANVSLIYSAAPFLAAGIAWCWFREPIVLRILLGASVAVVGVGTIVGGSLGHVHLAGDLLALWMTLMMSTVMVIYRRYPRTPAAGPAAVSSLLLLPPALCFADPASASAGEIVVLAAFGLVFAVASVTLSEGARRLAPGEAALISALETPLAILWAWFLFDERPHLVAAVGGGLVMAAVFGSQLASVPRLRGIGCAR